MLRFSAASTGLTRLAPLAPGRGWVLGELGVLRVDGAQTSLASPRLPELQALGTSGAERLWAVSASDDDALPHAFTVVGTEGEYAPEVPAAAYAAVAPWGEAEIWMVGGLDITHNGAQAWPAGEGLVVHRSTTGVVWCRVPAGPLLAVTAVGPGKAWAVGAAGLVVHVAAGKVDTWRLPSAAWLRDVAGTDANELWLVGDDGTLLHRDLSGVTAVGALPLPVRPQLLSVARRGPRRVWVVSPDGILAVEARGG